MRTIQIGTLDAWENRVRACAQQTKENPLIEGYLNERFAIELAMGRLRAYKKSTGRLPKIMTANTATHRLYAFAAMLAHVYERLTPRAQKALAGRVRGGLKDDNGLASVAFELQVASNLMLHGVDVDWHDLENNGGFDFLTRHGELEAEIECKTFSADVGRKIHQRRTYQLGGLIHEALANAIDRLGTTFIEVVVEGNLSGGIVPVVGDLIKKSLVDEQEFAGPSPCSIILRPFAIEGSPFDGNFDLSGIDNDVIASFVKDRFDCASHSFLVLSRPRAGVMLVSVRSQLPDTVTDGIYRQLSAAAKQLSRARPGIIYAHLLDLTPAELRDLHHAPKTPNQPFHKMMTEFFESENRSHVHTTRFSTPGIVRRNDQVDGNIRKREASEIGPSFILTSNAHPLASDPRMKIFF